MSTAITKSWIPKQFYFGINRYADIVLYPSSDDEKIDKSNKEKRDYRSSEETRKVIDNIPLSGFRIEYTNGDWKILDPRGFSIKVSMDVFSTFMTNCVIENGEVLSKCIWAWYKNPILISEEFPEYANAKKNTEEKPANCKDLKPGDRFSFPTVRTKMVYLGDFYERESDTKTLKSVYEEENGSAYWFDRFSDTKKMKYYFNPKESKVMTFTSRKIVDLEPATTPLTDKEVDEYISKFYNKKVSKVNLKITIEVINKSKFVRTKDQKAGLDSGSLLPMSNSSSSSSSKLYRYNTPILNFAFIYTSGRYFVITNPYSHVYRNFGFHFTDDVVTAEITEEDIKNINKKLSKINISKKSIDKIMLKVLADMKFDFKETKMKKAKTRVTDKVIYFDTGDMSVLDVVYRL